MEELRVPFAFAWQPCSAHGGKKRDGLDGCDFFHHPNGVILCNSMVDWMNSMHWMHWMGWWKPLKVVFLGEWTGNDGTICYLETV